MAIEPSAPAPQRMKTALEIAMERSATIEVDEVQLRRQQLRTFGQQLVNRFLSGELADLRPFIAELPLAERRVLLAAIENTALSHLELSNNNATTKAETCFSLLLALKPDAADLVQQLQLVIAEFRQYQEQIKDRLDQEFAATANMLQGSMAQRMGASMEIKPEQVPQYQQKMTTVMQQLTAQYQPRVATLKAQIQAVPAQF